MKPVVPGCWAILLADSSVEPAAKAGTEVFCVCWSPHHHGQMNVSSPELDASGRAKGLKAEPPYSAPPRFLMRIDDDSEEEGEEAQHLKLLTMR